MKLAALICSILLSGCTVFVQTARVNPAAVKSVPPERVLAYQEYKPGYGEVEITRDAGFIGSGCFLAASFNDVVLGRFDTEERASFYLPAGTQMMSVVPDPEGRLLCSGNFIAPAVEPHEVVEGKILHLRMRLGAYRRPWLVEDKH